MIARKDILPRGWGVIIQVKPFGKVSGWSNILHATVGGNIKNYGDRIPGIWFHSKSTKLHICSAVNRNLNYCYNAPQQLHPYRFTTIVIQQVQKKNYGNNYFYQIIIDGKKVVDVINNNPRIFKNVKYFVSDPWYNAAKVEVRNFRIVTLKHQGIFLLPLLLLLPHNFVDHG